MQDSLMNIKSCLLTINPIAYLTKNRIVVKDFVLEQPEIYAYVDSAGVPNWDILRIAADTTTVDTTMADTTLSIREYVCGMLESGMEGLFSMTGIRVCIPD